MKNRIGTIILIVAILTGLSLLLYPTFSNYWNQHMATHAVATYTDAVNALDDGDTQAIWDSAVAYNQALTARGGGTDLSDEQLEEYYNTLDVSGTGVMGYIDIPDIGVSLPIYHGVDDSVLQIAAGHIEWSSLPVGGTGTHCVLSGHRGLPSAKLFTDLDELVEGDTFTLHILDQVLTYEVDQILIVLPEETDALQLVDGEDYCTLVTCTPYGINTHRLLVRGHRIETEAAAAIVSSDAVQVEPLIVAPIVATPILIILLIAVFVTPSGQKKEKAEKQEKQEKKKKAHSTRGEDHGKEN